MLLAANTKVHYYFIILFFLSILIISLNAKPPPRSLFVSTSFSLQGVQVPSRGKTITVGVSGHYNYQAQRYVWIVDKKRDIKRLLVPRSTTVLGFVPWKKGQHNNHESEETDNNNKEANAANAKNNQIRNDIDLNKGNSPVPSSPLNPRTTQQGNKRRPLFLFVQKTVRNVLSRVPFPRPRRKTHPNNNGVIGSMVHFPVDTEPNVIHEHFMKLALEQARMAFTKGEVPIGAIVVQRVVTSQMEQKRRGGGELTTTICFQILSCAYNRVETLKDPTAQAELLALRNAATYCDNWRLSGNNNNTETTLYTTLEPCAMCVSSCQAFRVNHVVYGFSDSNAGAVKSFSNSSSPPHPYHPHMTITKFELSSLLLDDKNVTIMQEHMTRNSTNKNDTKPITTSKTSPAIKNTAADNDDLSLFQLLDNDPDIVRTMNELQMAEQNLLDAEQELNKLVEFSSSEKTTIITNEQEDQSLLKTKDLSPGLGVSLGRLANLRRTLFPKRQQTKKKKLTMPSDQVKVKEEEPLNTTTQEEDDDLMSNIILTPKQILETHVTENTLEEIKRVQQASLEKTEDDVLRILNDIEHIKQIFQPTITEGEDNHYLDSSSSGITSEGSDEPPNTTKKVEEETPPTILRIWKRKG